LFAGSSSIRLWDVQASWPDRPVLNRGFGGSTIADSIHFFDRIVTPYQPRAIVLYAGDNDVAKGLSADQVRADYRRFISLAEERLPGTPVIYIAIKPSLKRWHLWPTMRDANDRIANFCREQDHLHFADIAEPMLQTAPGRPAPEFFAGDGLHLSPRGYALWETVLQPVLEEALR